MLFYVIFNVIFNVILPSLYLYRVRQKKLYTLVQQILGKKL